MAWFDPRMRPLLPLLGSIDNVTRAKAERLLGWTARFREEVIVATTESL